ncbi:tautomerase family protein [Azohydromonas lata]|uniref:tautomerase family protein n=1 Tax=Azohydromonas lata TaxID=45677 RepID=UPI000A046D6D|nr:tautomerase family protein [Azohydromonas lata]
MPLVRIHIAGSTPSPAQVAALQQRATALMAGVLGKRADLTVVAVEHHGAAQWSVGGAALAVGGRPLAQLDALITAGTNSEAEKSAFIGAAHALLADVLGPLASPVYVALRELPAGDWGYDGLTQAARRDALPVEPPYLPALHGMSNVKQAS